jgi:PAS domain S-box-containing protein
MSVRLGKGLSAKVALLGVGSVLTTATALVALAVWQSGQYNRMAQSEVNGLIEADLDHITRGVFQLVQTENEAVQHQVDYNLNVARHVLANIGDINISKETVSWTAINQFTGEPVTLQLPKMLLSDRWLGQNTESAIETLVVDGVTRLVGETATIFQRINEKGDMLRVATTVKDEEGRRAIGTYIPAVNTDGTPNPVIANVLKGETYHGRAFVVNAWYLTAYEPLKDRAGNLVGMLYVGVKHQTVEARVRQAILRTTVGKTGYVYVLGGKGKDRGRYVISQGGERDGENIWESKDSDGHHMIQAIVNKAVTLKPGELATERYRWKNPDDPAPRWKVARLAYYAPWDWVIGTCVYEDELQSYQALLTSGRIQMTSTMCLAGLAITLLIGLVGTLVAWTVTRPVQQMTKAVETIIQGNLSQTLDICSHDEIGALAEAFNVMTSRLSSTMEGLRRSEEKYRYIFENAIEGLYQTSTEGRFLSVSPAMARMLGYDSPEELMASVTNVQQQLYVHPEDRDVILAAVFESKGVVEKEVQFYRKDKQTIWILLNIQTMRDNAGKPLFLQGFVTDITVRKRTEEALQKVSKMQAVILDNSTVGIALVRNQVFEWVNPRMPELFDLPLGQIQGASTRIIYPDDETYDRLSAETYPILAQGKKATLEAELRKGDGSLFWCRFEGSALDASRLQDGSIWIWEDITQRRRAEQQLAEALDLNQKMIAASSVGIITYKASGPCVVANSAAASMVNASISQLLAQNFRQTKSWQTCGLFQMAKTTLQTKATQYGEFQFVTTFGKEVRLECHMAPFTSQGELHLLLLMTDITDRKRTEEDLYNSRRMLQLVLDTIPQRVFWKDRNCSYLGCNKPFAADAGEVSPSAMIGKNDFELGWKNVAKFYQEDDKRVMETNTAKLSFEEPQTKPNGDTLWLCTSKVPLHDRQGQVIGILGTYEDITERKRAEEALRESEERYRKLVENSPDAIYVQCEGKIVFSNPQFLRLIRAKQQEEIIGRELLDFVHPDHRAIVSERIRKMRQEGGTPPILEEQYLRLDGSAVEVEVVASPFLYNGKPSAQVIVRDITERKQTEKALQQANLVVENSPVVLFRWKAAEGWPVEFVSDNVIQFGYTPKELRSGAVPFASMVYPEDLDRLGREVQEYSASGLDRFQQQYRIVTKDGKVRWIDDHTVVERDQQGQIAFYQGIVVDITERKQAEDVLREARRRLDQMIEFLPDATFVINREGKVIAWNRAMEEMCGISKGEMIGKDNYEYCIPFYGERRPILIDLALRADEDVEKKYDSVRRSGDTLCGEIYTPKIYKGKGAYLWGTASVLRDAQGTIVGAIESIRDITDRKQADEAFRQAREAAEQANRAKSEFLAHMSHEIRTPLNGILGMTELLMETYLDESQINLIHTIITEAESLLTIINDVLDFSKIEAGKLELEMAPFNLQLTMETVATGLAIGAQQKGLEFASFLDPEVSPWLVGDPGRLRQILVNLVGNAVKFTERGEIYMKAELIENLGKKVRVRFSVRDTGIGIPTDKQERIFESFTQVDGSTTRKYGGTGLGTTISKKLVEMMGGKIGLESEPGKGSLFWFTLDFVKQADQKQQLVEEKERIDFHLLKVLVVDDNQTNRTILQEYLRSWDCTAIEAMGGPEALSILTVSGSSHESFDLILTDYRMPGMDGLALVQEIKSAEGLQNIPIVVLASVSDTELFRNCADMGIRGYLTKPIRRDELRKTIESVLSISSEGKSPSAPQLLTRETLQEETRHNIRILLVEDYPTNQQVAIRHLQNAGYVVHLAENGKQAVDAIQSKNYDIILMDIQMPVMDGYEATQAIREQERKLHDEMKPSAKRVPIVAMTAHAVKEYVQKSIESGMDDYIAKPLRKNDLLAVVEKWTTPQASHEEVEATPQVSSSKEGTTPMDFEMALQEFDGDKEFLKNILRGFIENVRKQIAVIRQALIDDDVETIRREAHSIKGGAANLMAQELSTIAAELETRAKTGRVENGYALVDRLEGAFHGLGVYDGRI